MSYRFDFHEDKEIDNGNKLDDADNRKPKWKKARRKEQMILTTTEAFKTKL